MYTVVIYGWQDNEKITNSENNIIYIKTSFILNVSVSKLLK